MHLALLFATKDIFQVVCAPIAGMTTLRLGARVSFAASLLGLALSTVAFAEARGFRALLLARALQGATSAALMTGGLSLITQTHDPSSRASAIAKAHSGLGLGAALGPVLGGLAYDTLGRRGTFYAAAALVLLTFAAQVVLSVAAPAPLARQPDSAEEKKPALRQLTSDFRNPFGIYRGLLPTLAYTVPAQAAFYLAFEVLLARLPPAFTGLWRQLMAGGCAGVVEFTVVCMSHCPFAHSFAHTMHS